MCVGLRSPRHAITLNPSDLFNSKNCRSQPTTSSTCWAPRNSPRITTCRALWLRSGSTCSLSVGGFGASRTWTHGVDPRWSYIITIYRIWYWYIHIIYIHIYNPTYVTCVYIIMYTVCDLCREVFWTKKTVIRQTRTSLKRGPASISASTGRTGSLGIGWTGFLLRVWSHLVIVWIITFNNYRIIIQSYTVIHF